MMNMTNKITISTLILAAAASTTALAQKQTPPEGAPPKAFTVPAHESYTLPNGLKITLVPYGIIPKVTVSLAVNAGSINEGSNHGGVASITSELLKEGTEKLTPEQLADEAARMGSTVSVTATDDQTIAELDILSEFGPDAVRLLSDVLQHPRLPDSELPRLKTDLLRQIALGSSRPQVIAQMHFRKIIYGDHPYSVVLPSDTEVKAITLDDVKTYFNTNFNPERSHLYVAGKFETGAVKKAISESFSKWPKGGAPWKPDVPSPKSGHTLDVTDRPGAPQSTLIIGLPVPPPNSPDAIPLLVTNALLGGSFNSRITANIREQKGYTYSPFSTISRRYHDAYWAENADVTTQFTGPSIKEIFGEIDRLKGAPPADPELKGIQNYLSGLFIIQNSSRGALITQLQYVDFQGLGEDYLKTYVAKVNAVAPADVQKMTANYLKPDQMTIVVVGDKSKITDQLTPWSTQ
ncbi:insulinase family protein [Alloacidobacterium dinghuense]|uniref:Insulinase family protein n=1 Tax=Alloacidobacterium dinghuense TaxID=2763107 RepID=A0A7G8BKB7_9BACT|nr:pitrilysin family protein [Alloacidobacterium dinghuense]QNI32987.1 insulinase family protein [Alloacidobacterium dinghuense]